MKFNGGLPYLVLGILVMIAFIVLPKYGCSSDTKIDYVDRIVERWDTISVESVIEKYIIKRGRTVYPPPDTIVKNDTMYINTAPFTAVMDTVLTSVTKSDSGDVVSITDEYNISYSYPNDLFKVKNKQTVNYDRVNKEIIKIVKQDLRWYNKPEYTVPLGFIVGGVTTAYVISVGSK